MKSGKYLINYLNQQFETLAGILEKPVRELEAADYHRLRTTLKRIRAGAALLDYGTRKFPLKKTVKPLKKLFRHAGGIRERQLELALLTDLGYRDKLPGLAAGLEKSLEKKAAALEKLAGKKFIAKVSKRKKQFVKPAKKLKHKAVNDFLEDRMAHVALLRQIEVLNTKQLHDVRKNLKEYLYAGEAFPEAAVHSPVVDEVQELLGQWHDYAVIGRRFRKALRNAEPGPGETADARALVAEIREREKAVLRQLTEAGHRLPAMDATPNDNDHGSAD